MTTRRCSGSSGTCAFLVVALERAKFKHSKLSFVWIIVVRPFDLSSFVAKMWENRPIWCNICDIRNESYMYENVFRGFKCLLENRKII